LLLLFPWFIPLASYLALGPVYLTNGATFAGATLLHTLLGVSLQLSLDWVTQYVTALYPDIDQTAKRLIWLTVTFLVITLSINMLGLWVYRRWQLFGFVGRPDVELVIFVLSVVVTILSVGIYESFYSLQQWRATMLRKEQLKKANLQSQYEGLKNQVNPHFLFNTLNTLSSLIADEPERAEAFVDEMARVYRYLLQSNQRPGETTTGELTTLGAELDFMQSYFHLLKTRYGAGIQLEVIVPEADLLWLLPPLTLQMLVENAVKHNALSPGRPLVIEIKSAPDRHLLVRNNRQPKTTRSDRRPVLSNGVGLSNIRAKYRLLAGPTLPLAELLIDESERYFTVVLPLLDPKRP